MTDRFLSSFTRTQLAYTVNLIHPYLLLARVDPFNMEALHYLSKQTHEMEVKTAYRKMLKTMFINLISLDYSVIFIPVRCLCLTSNVARLNKDNLIPLWMVFL